MSLYRGAGGASDATDDSTVNAVAGYATDAAASASSAATSATNASNSATAAASSASSAATSASSVATNATNAATSAGLANTYAAAASSSKDAAAALATTASTKAGEASSSASNAASSASTASTQATNAASSASAAATSASAASTSASNAASSASSALAIYGNTTAMNNAVASAATSASNAATSASEANDSRILAEAAVTGASSYASAAQASANDSQAYAGASEAFKDSALAAASDANISATNAATSEANAAASAASAAAITGSGNGTFVNTPITTNSTVTLSSGTANGVPYLNGSKVLTTGSGLVFNGTNLGVGTTSPSYKLHVTSATPVFTLQDSTSAAGGVGGTINFIAYTSGTSGANLEAQIKGVKSSANAAGELQFFTSTSAGVSTLRAIIDGSGNLGLGVTPSAWISSRRVLQIGGTTVSNLNFGAAIGETAYNMYYTSGGTATYQTTGPAAVYDFNNAASGGFAWRIAASGTAGNTASFTQAMTLDASGNLLVATTTASTTDTGNGTVLSSIGGYIISRRVSGATQTHLQFANGGATVGNISSSTTATTYNTSSDYRLKNITGPISNSGAYIDSLKPVEGTWKSDGSVFVGLLAHEAQEVSRTPVASGVKDGEEMQTMSYSSSEMIANMIAELKSLRARVAALESN